MFDWNALARSYGCVTLTPTSRGQGVRTMPRSFEVMSVILVCVRSLRLPGGTRQTLG
jgi:hypothetical protein